MLLLRPNSEKNRNNLRKMHVFSPPFFREHFMDFIFARIFFIILSSQLLKDKIFLCSAPNWDNPL